MIEFLPAQENQFVFIPDKPSQTFANLDNSGDFFYVMSNKKSSSGIKLVRRLDETVQVNAMRYNSELQPVWNSSISIECGVYGYGPFADILTYDQPGGKGSVDYMLGDSELVQINPDGSVNRANFPDKKKKMSAFTDSRGLNIITFSGKKKFPSGIVDWHTYSHEGLSMQKRTVNLPIPPDIDEENESHWNIKAVGEEGLYFAYVSYKNEVKEKNRAVLSLHYVLVDYDGKCSDIKSIVLEQNRYIIIPVDHTVPSELRSSNLFSGGFRNWSSYSADNRPSSKVYYIPNDNAYACVEFDPVHKRIYTLVARNEAMDEKKPRMPSFSGRSFPVQSLTIDLWDMDGRSISQTVIKHAAPQLKALSDYSYFANKVRLQALPNGEGVICMLLNNQNGFAWALDDDGALAHSLEYSPYSQKVLWLTRSMDKYSDHFHSMRDFETSPYWGKSKSKVAAFFERLSEEEKENFYHISMKDNHVVAVWDEEANTAKIYAFAKEE